jgi:osmotically inducible protein OsmC
MAMISKGTATWSGDLATGSGQVSAASGLFQGAPVSWAKRANDRSTGTSPEELLAAAHAACYDMALSARLGKNGTPATSIETTASVSFDKLPAGGFGITASDLVVAVTAPGLTNDKLQELAADAKENCPVSKALAGNVKVSVAATLRG